MNRREVETGARLLHRNDNLPRVPSLLGLSPPGLTNVVSPGSFPLQILNMCTTDSACQTEESRSPQEWRLEGARRLLEGAAGSTVCAWGLEFRV